MTPTPLSDSWERGDPYEQYVGRWSRRVAPEFLRWLAMPSGLRWLDVGCGTGALCAAILDACSPASLDAVEPSEGFRRSAAANLGDRAQLHGGSAEAIALPDAVLDVVVSGLVLNFVPRLNAALTEMARVAAPDGVIAAYVWDYAGRMDLIRIFWDAATTLDPAAAALDEGVRFPLCSAPALSAAFRDAGLRKVETAAIVIPTVFTDFDSLWTPFLGGQGPAPAYTMSLDEDARQRLREAVRDKLTIESDGSIHLIARAWLVRGSRFG